MLRCGCLFLRTPPVCHSKRCHQCCRRSRSHHRPVSALAGLPSSRLFSEGPPSFFPSSPPSVLTSISLPTQAAQLASFPSQRPLSQWSVATKNSSTIRVSQSCDYGNRTSPQHRLSSEPTCSIYSRRAFDERPTRDPDNLQLVSHNHDTMVASIPNLAGSSGRGSPSYFDLSSRRSLNPVCHDVQATLSTFRFSSQSPAATDMPAQATQPMTASISMTGASDDDEYVEPSCMLDTSSRRPSVQRTSSAPEPSSSKPSMFVEAAGPSMLRPSLARACSESRASGVLERRRCKVASGNNALPSNLILDLADLPMTMGAGNIGLLRAARKAIAEPCGFDWGRTATSAPASTCNSRFVTHQQSRLAAPSSSAAASAAAKSLASVSLPASTTASASSSPESRRVASGLPTSRSCASSSWASRGSSSDESEWDWALAGNARATYEALRFSAYKETREPVHDIWQQLPDWVSRRSSLGGRDADLSLRGPSLHTSFAPHKPAKDAAAAAAATAAAAAAALSLTLSHASLSSRSPRNSISARSRGHQAKVSVHVPFRVVEEMAPSHPSISPRASFAGAREHALDRRRSRSHDRRESTSA